ncbi:4a-hydroxytetrahydrobiopterin dehydratase [Candidatus Parcubacteria bacterium]|uniref:4a-hydroxytetrahydrobiopterin dehydratase n=1 Tax=Candidatus Kaiserbacteria bacterium CG10_big_fil_rev_8_21_14_0_10_47_16 TaxID=1974608 RepID=A0A2H0UF99_9BACT|nr:4a-hydroxytetrahydrobiopterin dehydratase [Candidatus Parcubacteria bacterium]PIR84346.1 MAG: pterin-4-alpha-carbinolamine dehydratase [Candidatus Kaiserbacteria bacterium CG10_big_fil_rev_8_21_14_0_10_47_16]
MELTQQKCEACEGGVLPLNKVEADILLTQIPDWSVSEDTKTISRSYTFADFKEALAFVNRVGEIAESEGHHPDIHLTDYKNVRIDLSTHAILGLSNNDFILAAKIDA